MVKMGKRVLVGLCGVISAAHLASGAGVSAEESTYQAVSKLSGIDSMAWNARYALEGELALTNRPSQFFYEDRDFTHTGMFFLDEDVKRIEEDGYTPNRL